MTRIAASVLCVSVVDPMRVGNLIHPSSRDSNRMYRGMVQRSLEMPLIPVRVITGSRGPLIMVSRFSLDCTMLKP